MSLAAMEPASSSASKRGSYLDLGVLLGGLGITFIGWRLTELLVKPGLSHAALDQSLPIIVITAGSLISLLMFGLVYTLLGTNQRARVLADEMTSQLRVMKMAVDNAYDHIIITDSNGVIKYANSAVSRITGYDLTEVIGKTPRVWGGQMPPEFYENFWRTIKEARQVFTGEVRNRRKNGEIYYSILSAAPIEDEGRLLGFVGVEQDITERRKGELKLAHGNEELERLNKLMVGRELKMIELKEEINRLKQNGTK